jgi:hypothetical protein
MRKIVFGVAYLILIVSVIGLLLIGTLLEWNLVAGSFWQFINPFIYIQVLLQMLCYPITYLLAFLAGVSCVIVNKFSDKKEDM